MNKIEIRRPGMSDQAQLHQFFRVMIIDTWTKEGLSDLSDDIEAEINDKVDYLRSDLEGQPHGQYFLVAFDQDKVVGTIAFGRANALIHSLTQGTMSHLMEINTAFVHPDMQGQGIGGLLLRELFGRMRELGILACCLDSGYSRAQSIWRAKFGEPAYIAKDYWGPGHDHMVWRISLT